MISGLDMLGPRQTPHANKYKWNDNDLELWWIYQRMNRCNCRTNGCVWRVKGREAGQLIERYKWQLLLSRNKSWPSFIYLQVILYIRCIICSRWLAFLFSVEWELCPINTIKFALSVFFSYTQRTHKYARERLPNKHDDNGFWTGLGFRINREPTIQRKQKRKKCKYSLIHRWTHTKNTQNTRSKWHKWGKKGFVSVAARHQPFRCEWTISWTMDAQLFIMHRIHLAFFVSSFIWFVFVFDYACFSTCTWDFFSHLFLVRLNCGMRCDCALS